MTASVYQASKRAIRRSRRVARSTKPFAVVAANMAPIATFAL